MQRTNEEALDLFADLLEPAADILSDAAVTGAYQSGNRLMAIKYAVKNHKKAVIELLARIDGVPVEQYKVSAVTIPLKLVELLNIPEVQDLFSAQGQKSDAAPSGSATENIEGGAN